MTRTYAIGDIHGCLAKLLALAEFCRADAGEQRAKFVFLGDYIDRGPSSREGTKCGSRSWRCPRRWPACEARPGVNTRRARRCDHSLFLCPRGGPACMPGAAGERSHSQ